jgi:AraC-like DNA-binding protein
MLENVTMVHPLARTIVRHPGDLHLAQWFKVNCVFPGKISWRFAIAGENSIETLASNVAMSPRNLSRVFKEVTGCTIVEYLTSLRRENAKTLMNNPDYTIECIASECGFKSARQLQRILK